MKIYTHSRSEATEMVAVLMVDYDGADSSNSGVKQAPY